MGVPAYRCVPNTNRNRRKLLKERMLRYINNSSLPPSEKNFIKPLLLSILQEYAELYEVRRGNVQDNPY